MKTNKITSAVSQNNISELALKLGYNNKSSFLKTYEKFNQADCIKDWLATGHYDLVNNAESFVSKLTTAIGLDIEKEITQAKEYLAEKAKFRDGYIIAETDFKTKNRSLFIMMHHKNKRTISLYDREELMFKSLAENLATISQMIAENHLKMSDQVMGNILHYKVSLLGEEYIFDSKGYLLQ